MSEEKKTLLNIQLLLQYYKNDNILDSYHRIIESGIIFDNEILDEIQPNIYVVKYNKYIKLEKEIDRLNNNLEMLEKENKILKYTVSKALEFINNHTYRWKDTQFGEMVEVEEFEQGLKPIELINILKNEFENK